MWCGICEAEVDESHDMQGEYEDLGTCAHCDEKIIDWGSGWMHYMSGESRCGLSATPASSPGGQASALPG